MPTVLERTATKAGSPKDALARRRRMDENVSFALDHLEEWRKLHPNSWIAVHDRQLVAAEPGRERLLDSLKARGVPLAETYFDFLSEERAALIL